MTVEEKKDIIDIMNHLSEVINDNKVAIAESNVDIKRELELESNDIKNSKIFVASKMAQNGLAASILKRLDNHLKNYSNIWL